MNYDVGEHLWKHFYIHSSDAMEYWVIYGYIEKKMEATI